VTLVELMWWSAIIAIIAVIAAGLFPHLPKKSKRATDVSTLHWGSG